MKSTLLALSLVLFAILVFAQEKVDQSTDAKMRSEELEHSKIMHTLHMLTDRYGPRVTGTPNHELAAKWAARSDDAVGYEESASGSLGIRASGVAE